MYTWWKDLILKTTLNVVLLSILLAITLFFIMIKSNIMETIFYSSTNLIFAEKGDILIFSPLENHYYWRFTLLGGFAFNLNLVNILIINFNIFILFLCYLFIYKKDIIYILSRLISLVLSIYYFLPYEFLNLVPFSVECSGKGDFTNMPKDGGVGAAAESRKTTMERKAISDATTELMGARRSMGPYVDESQQHAAAAAKSAASAQAYAQDAKKHSDDAQAYYERASSASPARPEIQDVMVQSGKTAALTAAVAVTTTLASGHGTKAAVVSGIITGSLTGIGCLIENYPTSSKNDG